MGIKYRNFKRPPKTGPLNFGFDSIIMLIIFAAICIALAFYVSDSTVLTIALMVPVVGCAYGIITELISMFGNNQNKEGR